VMSPERKTNLLRKLPSALVHPADAIAAAA
jgi:hypothetical protein